jgi:hypothetical protein
MAEMARITIRLSAKEIATLDKRRGGADRSTYLRTLIRRDARSRRKRVKPTREMALQALAEHAEHDPGAARHLEEVLRQDAELERMRRLTTDAA